MNINDVFDGIYEKAKKDKSIKRDLMEIYQSNDALTGFCEYAKRLGYDIAPGDILTAGEEYSCNQLKSTNGGGVNPYDLFDDPLDNFMVSIESIR